MRLADPTEAQERRIARHHEIGRGEAIRVHRSQFVGRQE
jgi:hypothetical protein